MSERVSIKFGIVTEKLVATAVTISSIAQIAEEQFDECEIYNEVRHQSVHYILEESEFQTFKLVFFISIDDNKQILGTTSIDVSQSVGFDHPVIVKKNIGGDIEIPIRFMITKTEEPLLKTSNVLANLTTQEIFTILHAVIRIQKVFRGLLRRVRSHKLALQRIWTELDWKEESELSQTHASYEKLKTQFKELTKTQTSVVRAEVEKTVVRSEGLERITGEFDMYVEEAQLSIAEAGRKINLLKYVDLDLEFDEEITAEWIVEAVTGFQKGKFLCYNATVNLLRRGFKLLSPVHNVNAITIPQNGKCVVIGDIHGQLSDLVCILQDNGFPTPDNILLFNGDIVDRGQNSMECLLTLLALKIYCPEGIHINRGNHESRDMNSQNGFEEECWDKYDGIIFDLISCLFAVLPLCSIVHESAFVVHAGLTDKSNIDTSKINKEDRYHVIPPHCSLLEDFLWSDPDEFDGFAESPRGAGVRFGPDVARKFRKDNKFSVILRSHECVDDGFEKLFGGTLFTVFSASNYCDEVGNLGAVCILTRKEDKHAHKHVHKVADPEDFEFDQESSKVMLDWRQWYAEDRKSLELKVPKIVVKAAGNQEVIKEVEEGHQVPLSLIFEKKVHKCLSVEKETIARLESKILEKLTMRVSLGALGSEKLLKAVQDKDGNVTVEQWEKALQKALQLEVPFSLFLPQLAGVDADTNIVNVESFLDRYEIRHHQLVKGTDDPIDEKFISTINHLLYSHSTQLKAVYRHVNASVYNKLSEKDFRAGLESLVCVLKMQDEITEKHIDYILSKTPKAEDGQIDYNEFFEAFYHSGGKAKEESANITQRSLGSYGALSAEEVEVPVSVSSSPSNKTRVIEPVVVEEVKEEVKEVVKTEAPKKKKKIVFHMRRKSVLFQPAPKITQEIQKE